VGVVPQCHVQWAADVLDAWGVFKVLWKLSKVVGLTERNPEEPAAGRTATVECVT
jgi:hypothetical protein